MGVDYNLYCNNVQLEVRSFIINYHFKPKGIMMNIDTVRQFERISRERFPGRYNAFDFINLTLFGMKVYRSIDLNDDKFKFLID